MKKLKLEKERAQGEGKKATNKTKKSGKNTKKSSEASAIVPGYEEEKS